MHHVVLGSNLTTQSNFWDQHNAKILLPRSSQVRLHISQLKPGIQDYRLSWAFSKHKPSLMLGKT